MCILNESSELTPKKVIRLFATETVKVTSPNTGLCSVKVLPDVTPISFAVNQYKTGAKTLPNASALVVSDEKTTLLAGAELSFGIKGIASVAVSLLQERNNVPAISNSKKFLIFNSPKQIFQRIK